MRHKKQAEGPVGLRGKRLKKTSILGWFQRITEVFRRKRARTALPRSRTAARARARQPLWRGVSRIFVFATLQPWNTWS